MLLAAYALSTVQDAPGVFGQPSLWIQLASLVALVLIAVGIWVLVVHLRETRDETRRLASLEGIESKLARLLEERGDLDLRRLEHLLLDLREIQGRTEDALVRLFERESAGASGATEGRGIPIEELARVRLLALGYASVEIVGRVENGSEGGGEFLVEATRDGARFKGSVRVADGRISRVDMRPEYTAFP